MTCQGAWASSPSRLGACFFQMTIRSETRERTLELVGRLTRAGWSIDQIASELGCHARTAARYRAAYHDTIAIPGKRSNGKGKRK